jgi:hypothetical protein
MGDILKPSYANFLEGIVGPYLLDLKDPWLGNALSSLMFATIWLPV